MEDACDQVADSQSQESAAGSKGACQQANAAQTSSSEGTSGTGIAVEAGLCGKTEASAIDKADKSPKEIAPCKEAASDAAPRERSRSPKTTIGTEAALDATTPQHANGEDAVMESVGASTAVGLAASDGGAATSVLRERSRSRDKTQAKPVCDTLAQASKSEGDD